MNRNLIRYFDKQLPDAEIARFEQELSQSPRLREQYATLRKAQDRLDHLKATPQMDDYFAEARVRFRSNMENKRSHSVFSQYALAGSGAFTLTVMLFFSISTNLLHFNQPAIETAYNNTNIVDEMSIEKAEVPSAENIIPDDEKTGVILQKKIDDEAGIRPENADNLLRDMDLSTDELVANLQTDEIDPVLNKLK